MILKPVIKSIIEPIITGIIDDDYGSQYAILDENLDALTDLLGNEIEEEY